LFKNDFLSHNVAYSDKKNYLCRQVAFYSVATLFGECNYTSQNGIKERVVSLIPKFRELHGINRGLLAIKRHIVEEN